MKSAIGKTATIVRQDNGTMYVRYHDTDVVTFVHEKIWLDTGGWFTATTKRRMNEASTQFDLGYYVYQLRGKWYAKQGDKVTAFDGNTCTLYRPTDKRYEIVRFYRQAGKRSRRTGRNNLTLEEAQKHCGQPETRKEGEWFDGYQSY